MSIHKRDLLQLKQSGEELQYQEIAQKEQYQMYGLLLSGSIKTVSKNVPISSNAVKEKVQNLN